MPDMSFTHTRPKTLSLIAVGIFWLSSLGLFGCKASPSLPLIQVGEFKLSQADLNLRKRQVALFYPNQKKKNDQEIPALAQLIKGYLAASILHQVSRPIDKIALENEGARIQKNSRDPEKLKALQTIFTAAQKAGHKGQKKSKEVSPIISNDKYLTVGLLPDFAQSRLHHFFLNTPVHFDNTRPQAIEELKATHPAGTKNKNEHSKKDIDLTESPIKKPNYDLWFWEKAHKITVHIQDPDLLTRFIKNVSWARKLKLAQKNQKSIEQ